MASVIPSSFYGKYKLQSSENFDSFLKELGIGLLKRKMANTSYPTVELTKLDDEKLSFKSYTIIKNSETQFKLGEEFEEERLDGKRVKSVVHFIEGNKLVQTQRDGEQEIKYIREFEGDSLKVTSIVNNVKCFRVYNRIE